FTYISPPYLFTLSLHVALPIYPVHPTLQAKRAFVVDIQARGRVLVVLVAREADSGVLEVQLQPWGERAGGAEAGEQLPKPTAREDRKSTRLNSSHRTNSYAVF